MISTVVQMRTRNGTMLLIRQPVTNPKLLGKLSTDLQDVASESAEMSRVRLEHRKSLFRATITVRIS